MELRIHDNGRTARLYDEQRRAMFGPPFCDADEAERFCTWLWEVHRVGPESESQEFLARQLGVFRAGVTA